MTSFIPNSTQIPNVVIDQILPRLPESEARCLMYICRRTFGFKKKMDRIGLEQFAKGIQNKSSGEHLDYGAGVCRSAAKTALANLENAGIVSVKRGQSKSNGYELNMSVDIHVALTTIGRLKQEQNIRKKNGSPQKKLFGPEAIIKPKGDHKVFTEWWHDVVPKTRGIRPVYTKADMGNLKRILDAKILTQMQLQQIALYFLGSVSFRNFAPSMSTLFSSGVINGLMNRMENHPEFWRELNQLAEYYLRQKLNEPAPGMIQSLQALKNELIKSKRMTAAL